MSTLGWCGKAIDSLADRLQFDGFRDDNFDLATIYQMNNPDTIFDSAIRRALIVSCSFIYITLDDLGFVTDNPSSAEAIKASHETLRLMARKAQRNFGSGFLNAGYLAACLRDGQRYRRQQLYLTKPQWLPIFEPDASTLSLIGDGAIKLNQAAPGYMDEERLHRLTGLE